MPSQSIPVSTTTNPAIERAMQSVAAEVSRADEDFQRPRYHFGPPANWMNDPNGTIYANGYYQLFYQHNPYGDTWGHMHWGHARSQDLVQWEHLPIGLWPSEELGEEHVFSGCATLTAAGVPMLIYTKVGPVTSGERPANEQWGALGDADWIHWQKHPANPVLSLETHGGPPFEGEWRDPFIFHAGGRTFLVVAGDYGDTAAIALYEAVDGELARWNFRKVLHSVPRSEIGFSECPNFFSVENNWVLLTSPYLPVHYEVGDFDLETLTFSATTKGILDPGNTPEVTNAHYYASNILYAPDGRVILLGWIRGFPAGHGWNGCLALPRVLTIGDDRRPRQNPVGELTQLRGREVTFPTQTLLATPTIVATALDACLEIDTSLRLKDGQAISLRLRAGNSTEPALTISFDSAILTFGATSVPFSLAQGEELRLHLFVDRSVSELYVNDGRLAITTVQKMPTERLNVEFVPSVQGLELVSFTAWELSAIR